jgi:hypothetical protein
MIFILLLLLLLLLTTSSSQTVRSFQMNLKHISVWWRE